METCAHCGEPFKLDEKTIVYLQELSIYLHNRCFRPWAWLDEGAKTIDVEEVLIPNRHRPGMPREN